MKAKIFGIEFSVSFPAAAFLTLAVVSDNKGAVLLCIMSSFLHEAGHLAAMYIKGAKLKSVRFNLGDVAINADSSNLSYSSEIFITISGVAVNFILAIIAFTLFSIFKADVFYSLFTANLVIGIFNLLPVRFFDGGQLILLCLQNRLSQRVTDRVINILSVVFIVPIGVLGLLFLFNSSYNFSLLFAALYLICTLVSKEYKNVS